MSIWNDLPSSKFPREILHVAVVLWYGIKQENVLFVQLFFYAAGKNLKRKHKIFHKLLLCVAATSFLFFFFKM